MRSSLAAKASASAVAAAERASIAAHVPSAHPFSFVRSIMGCFLLFIMSKASVCLSKCLDDDFLDTGLVIFVRGIVQCTLPSRMLSTQYTTSRALGWLPSPADWQPAQR